LVFFANGRGPEYQFIDHFTISESGYRNNAGYDNNRKSNIEHAIGKGD
jgi:hypothetical protein